MLLVCSVLLERCRDLNDHDSHLVGMAKLQQVRSDIPAVTHVDYSTRVQTVHEHTNSGFYRLIRAFGDATGCPMLINTSFNVRGEPIVCTPEDALRCFFNTELDGLAIGTYFVDRASQDPLLDSKYSTVFPHD